MAEPATGSRAAEPAGTSLAAVTLDAGRTELRRIALPTDLAGGGLLRVAAAGVCGSDVAAYQRPGLPARIMGHENVGRIAALDPAAAARWRVEVGDRVLVEEYLPCGHCDLCRAGEHRYCAVTDAAGAAPLRFGTTPVTVAPALWGGYSQYQYLHPDAMLHRLPDTVGDEAATFALPIANGIQFLQIECGVRPGDRVLVLGPGQQGLGAVIAAREAGARVVVAGRATDGVRLAAAARLGAATVDVDADDLAAAWHRISGGRHADLVLDVAAGSQHTVDSALTLVRPGGTVALGASRPTDGGRLPVRALARAHLTVRGVRGHTFAAVRRALGVLAEGRYPVDELCNHRFGLPEVDLALRTAATGQLVHAVVRPWSRPEERSGDAAS
ncbi:MAG TPA: zinc-binding dehydrogenase [Pseudonocardia sp.]|jgi:threonine dehydrogenase-like Zn-dependent dehydrogenase